MSDIHGYIETFERALSLVDLSKPDAVLMVDTQRGKYYRATETGPWPILPYHEEN